MGVKCVVFFCFSVVIKASGGGGEEEGRGRVGWGMGKGRRLAGNHSRMGRCPAYTRLGLWGSACPMGMGKVECHVAFLGSPCPVLPKTSHQLSNHLSGAE